MSYDEIDALVPGKVYQFVALFGGPDYPVGGRGTLVEVTPHAIVLKMEFIRGEDPDGEWSLAEVQIPRNRMQWMRRMTTAPPIPPARS